MRVDINCKSMHMSNRIILEGNQSQKNCQNQLSHPSLSQIKVRMSGEFDFGLSTYFLLKPFFDHPFNFLEIPYPQPPTVCFFWNI